MSENEHEDRAALIGILRKGVEEINGASFVAGNNTLIWITNLRNFMQQFNITCEELGVTEARIREVERMGRAFEARYMVKNLQRPELVASTDDLLMLAALIKEHGFTAKDFDMDEDAWGLLLKKLDPLPQGHIDRSDDSH